MSDELNSLKSERQKRLDILEQKPDTKWAKDDLINIESEIKRLSPKPLKGD